MRSDFSGFPSVGDLVAVYFYSRLRKPRYILVTEVGECVIGAVTKNPTVHIRGLTEDGVIKRFYLMADQLGKNWKIVQRNTASVNEASAVVE